MTFGVVIFPGSNCDRDMLSALTRLGYDARPLWHKSRDLEGVDTVVLPGGFSYGDYLRSGAIARFSPIMDEVVTHANAGGQVIGVCNGFQILCEAGLLPGALLRNADQRFICDHVHITPERVDSPLTGQLAPGHALRIPIAHAEGRYFIDPAGLEELKAHDQILFRYTDADGQRTPEANPNGSVDDIAGVCNRQGNVCGMMPHPERAADPRLANIAGQAILQSLAMTGAAAEGGVIGGGK